MITQDDLGELHGAAVYDSAGEHIGSVGQIYVDPHGDDPRWVTVRTGTFGFQESFVPLQGASFADGRLTVPVAGDQVRQAPLLDTDAPLEYDHVDRLSAHYGLTSGSTAGGTPASTAGGTPASTAGGTPGSTAGGARGDDAMTRSEEHLRVGTRQEPVTKVRLRKYLVTEQRQITVPVTHEEVRLEEVPVTGDEPAGGTAADGTAADVVLHAQQPVVRTETVPVERVRLGTETVRDEEVVTRPVRRERIDYEGPDETR